MLRVPSPLPEDYARACRMELEARGISYDSEYSVPIYYKGQLICRQRIDLLIDKRLVLELKSIEAIHRVHVAQVVGYCRLTKVKVGLVVNFNVDLLRYGIKRVVL